MSKLTLVATIFLLLSAVANIQAQTGERSGEWHFFGGDSGSTKYSTLDLIDKENVANLEIAWRWESVTVVSISINLRRNTRIYR